MTSKISVTLSATFVQAPLITSREVIFLSLWITGFLCLLNIALAVVFRRKQMREVLSYYLACGIELVVFVVALLFHLGVISHVPYHLPSGLPIDRAQIGAALAIGIGLFPAAYWHRTNVSELPGRIAQDAKTVNERGGAVHVRKGSPGEWLN